MLLALWLLSLVALALVLTRNWPLVNDGALQHYITFLSDAGLAPYRQIADMNLPGSLMIDWAVVHLLGAGSVAWRVFDALLLLLGSVAMLLIARPWSPFAGLFSATLFWLLHARDGMGQTGQRDLMEAVLLLLVFAATVTVSRSGRQWPLALAGLCAGAATIIKPDSLLLSVILLGAALTAPGRRRASALLALTGFLVPLAAALAFLVHHGAVHAFWLSLTEITPLYASLGRQSLHELLRDCLSPPMRVFLALAMLLAVLERRRWLREQTFLALATAWGLASFVLQGKGYLYHRYPTLAFLLLWVGIACADALKTQSADALTTRSADARDSPFAPARNLPPLPRLLGALGLLYGCLVVAPLSLVRAAHATWSDDLLNALQADLTELDHHQSLNGRVQCIDSISGCNTVLLRLRLREETGMLSDFLLFGSPAQPAVRRARATFWTDINHRAPTVVVVTGWLHPTGPDGFRKLEQWPDFASFLSTRYILARQRSFAPGRNGPLSYRIYILR